MQKLTKHINGHVAFEKFKKKKFKLKKKKKFRNQFRFFRLLK